MPCIYLQFIILFYNKMKKGLMILALTGSSFLVSAQGVYTSNGTGIEPGRKAPPLPPLRQADVVYAKKVQEMIDSHEKKNAAMNWPLNSFMNVIYKYAATGDSDSYG